MNVPTATQLLPDVQAQSDFREQRIDAVGVKGVRYPIAINSGGRVVHTIAHLSMTVALGPEVKGTHMSRFLELLESRTGAFDQDNFRSMMFEMLDRRGAGSGSISMRFPHFVEKRAPVSGVSSRLDHEVEWTGKVEDDGRYAFRMRVQVPVTNMCPCSKEISAYGAHNQRLHTRIETEICGAMWMEELIAIAESNASCEVYALLKRVDEKFVNERAYDNPKFVEYLVRDVTHTQDLDPRIDGYLVEAENFESIQNHSAFARIEHEKSTASPSQAAKRLLARIEQTDTNRIVS